MSSLDTESKRGRRRDHPRHRQTRILPALIERVLGVRGGVRSGDSGGLADTESNQGWHVQKGRLAHCEVLPSVRSEEWRFGMRSPIEIKLRDAVVECRPHSEILDDYTDSPGWVELVKVKDGGLLPIPT